MQHRTTIGSLSCTLDDDGQAPRRIAVLCHGFGAPGDDLVGLAAELRRQGRVPAGTRFVFPEAPLSVPMSFGGRAWWHIDGERIFERVARGALNEVLDEVPSGLGAARRALRRVIEGALANAKLGYDALLLGGFSQGSMIAMDVALRLDEPPARLSLFSSMLICRPEWQRRASGRSGLVVFQSHGRQDPLLPLAGAEALRDLLTQAGCTVDFHAFDGGHTIPAAAVTALGAQLSAIPATR